MVTVMCCVLGCGCISAFVSAFPPAGMSVCVIQLCVSGREQRERKNRKKDGKGERIRKESSWTKGKR